LLGKRHAHLLSKQDVLRAQAAIAEGKTAVDVKTGPRGRARVRGGAGAARMAIIVLGVILNWAKREKLVKENPVADVQVGQGGKRTTILDGADDYARLFKTLDKMERDGRIRSQVADAIRLIALTGCRRGEAANLKWSHVNLRDGRLEIPPHSHKTGKRTGDTRVIGLPAAAQAVIAKQPAGDPDDYVFTPARGDGGALDLTHAWTKVRTEARLPKVGLHGLRHSLASHMAMNGAQAAEIMTALGHRQLSTSQRYVHWASGARQALAESAAATVLAGMAAAEGRSGKVVKLKGGRR
jgi:integrase